MSVYQFGWHVLLFICMSDDAYYGMNFNLGNTEQLQFLTVSLYETVKTTTVLYCTVYSKLHSTVHVNMCFDYHSNKHDFFFFFLYLISITN